MTEFSEKLKLQGFSAEQQKLCRDAFATLPEHIQQVILNANVVFAANNNEEHYEFKAERAHVEISKPVITKESQTSLAGYLGGFGLAAALHTLPIDISDDLFHKAYHEHYSDSLNQKLKKNAPVPDMVSSVADQDYLGNIAAILTWHLKGLGARVTGNPTKSRYHLFQQINEATLDRSKNPLRSSPRASISVGVPIPPPDTPNRDASIPTLKDLSKAQQEKFNAAYSQLPDYVSFLIEKNGVTFNLRTENTPDIHRGTEILIPDILFTGTTSVNGLSQFIAGAILAKHINIPSTDVNTRLIARAWGDFLDQSQSLGVWQGRKDPINPGNRGLALANIIASGSIHEGQDNTQKNVINVAKMYHENARQQYVEYLAHQEKARTWAEQYKATDTAFAINPEEGALTAPQREYFSKLNEVIQILGVTPKEFDDQFRFNVAKIVVSQVENTTQECIRQYEPQYVSPKDIKSSMLPVVCDPIAYDYKPHLKVKPRHVFDKEVEEKIYPYLMGMDTAHTVRRLDKFYGARNLTELPPDCKSQDSLVYTMHKALCEGIEDAMDVPVAFSYVGSEENILQSYANGVRNLPLLTASSNIQQHTPITITFPNDASYFQNAINNTISSIIATKVAAEQLTQDQQTLLESLGSEMKQLNGERTGSSLYHADHDCKSGLLWKTQAELVAIERQQKSAERVRIEQAQQEKRRNQIAAQAAALVAEEKKYGSVAFRMGNVCEFIGSDRLTPEQKTTACDAINASIITAALPNGDITPDNVITSGNSLTKAVELDNSDAKRVYRLCARMGALADTDTGVLDATYNVFGNNLTTLSDHPEKCVSQVLQAMIITFSGYPDKVEAFLNALREEMKDSYPASLDETPEDKRYANPVGRFDAFLKNVQEALPMGHPLKDYKVLTLEQIEAKKPKPYALPPAVKTHHHTLAKDEMVPLAAAFDLRFDAHKTLSDALFKKEILDIAETFLKGRDGNVRAFFDRSEKGKHPRYVAAINAAKLAVEQLFAQAPTEIAEDDPDKERKQQELNATEEIKKILLHSPVFLSLLLGNINEMNKASGEDDAGVKRLLVMDETVGLLRKHWEKMATLLLQPVVEKLKEAPPKEAPPVEGISTPVPPPPESTAVLEPEIIPAILPPLAAAAVVAGFGGGEIGSVIITPSAPVATSDTTSTSSAELDARKEACAEAQKVALADAEMFMLTAYDGNYNRFECSIDLKRNNFPITLKFANAQGEENSFTIIKHAEEFTNRGLTMTLGEAVDLKIGVQSKILNENGMEPLRDGSSTGLVGVKIDHAVPFHAKDPDKRKTTVKAGSGVLSWEINAPDRAERTPVTVSIPLGLPDEPQHKLTKNEELWIDGKGEKPEQITETAERVKVIMDFIEDNGRKKRWVTKRDVMDQLDNYIIKNNKEWVSRDSFPLSGYENAQLLHTVTNEAGAATQKITLSPVALCMDPGGDNPSWHMDFTIYANSDPNDPAYGKALRSRSMNLHTSNRELALARALQSMNGVTNGSVTITGFMDTLKKHAAQHPHDHWVLTRGDENRGDASVGSRPIQDFMDDMKRYEDDIGIELIKQPAQNGTVTFTMKALRAVHPDLLGHAKADPRVVCIKDRDKNRQQIQVTLTVPEQYADKIDSFAKAVSNDMGWHAAEAYSAVAIGTNGENDQRKKVQEYRPASIRVMLEKAIKSHHESFFDTKYMNGTKQPSNGNGDKFVARVAADNDDVPDSNAAGAER